ncbi:right-handed parallel beta-helix repeat-containing protein [Eubacterium sp.]|uniref:right-handed parallel beta-helix repeat-containing protein n=1 Tax=Eubacterium sp. TaxID=142586 RepID=UPI003F0A4AA9
MNNVKKALCLVLAVVTAVLLSSCSSQSTQSNKQPVPVNLSEPQQQQREKRSADIFVSPTGDDKNDGTKQHPVKTVERALELSKGLNKAEKVISFSRGEYSVSALNLSKDYNGTVFYAEDEVVFNGGVTLDPSDFVQYKDNIKMLDLKKYGVTANQIGQVRAFGQFNTASKYDEDGSIYCELFCDNQRMTLARYPNEDEESLRTGKIIDNGDSKETYTNKGTQQNPQWENMKNPKGGTFAADKDLINRMSGWKNSDDIWLFGYFQYDWADSTTPLASFDDDSITTKYASVYGFKEDMPYYFFNVFEELDAQGEWYIDRENLVLYFIPPADFESKSIQLSLETENLITLDGTQNITFDGITLCGTRAGAIKGTGNNITVENCTIKNVGETAVELEGEKIVAQSNTVTATGKAGIVLTGGDREALKSSENVVTNNLIYDWSQVYQTYQAAVALHGVGGVCSHNEIYNSPHEAITYSGNNHIIEYNVIHDVVLKSSDAGAIYAGRSWSQYGNIVRYNCIYNIGSEGFSPSGVYFDDALSGQEAYGNLLVNIPGNAFLLGGGRDLKVTNNVVVNAGVPISYDDRAIAGIADNGWFAHAKTPGEGLWATLSEYDVNSPVWKSAYPQLSQLSDDFSNTDSAAFAANPANSIVSDNVIINNKKNIGSIEKRVKKYSTVQNNLLYTFKNSPYTDSDYSKDPSIDGFEALPTDEMGRTHL